MRPATLAEHLFDEQHHQRLARAAEVHPVVLEDFSTPQAQAVLPQVQILLTGWGAPRLDRQTLAAMPRLRAVVSAGGSTGVREEDARERGLTLSNARLANSRPVAEYAAARILLAGKHSRHAAALYADRRSFIDREAAFPEAGNYRRRVGIVGASTTGRLTIDLLRPTDLELVVYDPWLTAADAAALGVQQVGLAELMASCDVVSVHAPESPATYHLIGAPELAALPDGATLINTARGSLVDTEALVAEVSTGRIDAVLDVTDPEPLPADHPLWELPNVLLTPHIAGSMGNELRRLGETAVREVERLAAGEQERQLEVAR